MKVQQCKDVKNAKSVIWMAAFFFNSRLPLSVSLLRVATFLLISLCCIKAMPVMLCELFMKQSVGWNPIARDVSGVSSACRKVQVVNTEKVSLSSILPHL